MGAAAENCAAGLRGAGARRLPVCGGADGGWGAATVGVDEADEEGHGRKLRLDGRFDEHLEQRSDNGMLESTFVVCRIQTIARALTVILSLSFRKFATFTMA